MISRCLTPVCWKKVHINGGFWGIRQETNRRVTLPLEYQRCEETGRLDAYRWDDDAERKWNLWVGDVGKLIEATAYSLATHPDADLARLMDDAIDRMLSGQKADGYLHCIQTPPAKRYTNLESEHELYDDGHNIEGAIAHFLSTGCTRFLDAMRRNADHLAETFGIEDGKHHGYDGHEEIELALVKLYRVTRESRYLALAKHFIDIRGSEPNYFWQETIARGEDPRKIWPAAAAWGEPFTALQAHRPVREQQDAVGHAVRACYLYSGMADVAVETGDTELLEACQRAWRSVTRRRMYITGGIGSTREGERFTYDYDLPNETAYAETCAAIALGFFAHRMLHIEADAEYADVLERALYNGVLSGISLDGTRFFYANPLTAYPAVSSGNADHLSVHRKPWFGTSCCPPNIARMIASVGQYLYSQRERELYVHLYTRNDVTIEFDGLPVRICQTTNYPWEEEVQLEVNPVRPADFILSLRLPGWCHSPSIRVNGEEMPASSISERGYARINRCWRPGDCVTLSFPMPVERVVAHGKVRMNAGKIALQRGPIVYCLEEVDNGPNLSNIVLPRSAAIETEYIPEHLSGAVILHSQAWRRKDSAMDDALYRTGMPVFEETRITAVPYCLWANREPGEMLVWIRDGVMM